MIQLIAIGMGQAARRVGGGCLLVMICVVPCAFGAPLVAGPSVYPTAVPEISTTGSAAIHVAPDRVVVTFGVESRAPVLDDAVRDCNTKMRAIHEAASRFQPDPKMIQTVLASIKEEKRDNWDGRQQVHSLEQIVAKSIVVCLTDVTKLDVLETAVLHAGANRMETPQFMTSQLRKYRDEARKMAAKAAKDKAELLAAQVALHVGRAKRISEGNVRWWYEGIVGSGTNSYAAQQNSVSSYGGGPSEDGDSAYAPGQIGVSSDVSITFELIN